MQDSLKNKESWIKIQANPNKRIIEAINEVGKELEFKIRYLNSYFLVDESIRQFDRLLHDLKIFFHQFAIKMLFAHLSTNFLEYDFLRLSNFL